MSASKDRKIREMHAEIERLTAERDALRDALKMARAELAGLPRSLGYDFTHLPLIDQALAKGKEPSNG